MVGLVSGCPRIDAAVAACVLAGVDLPGTFLVATAFTATALLATGFVTGTFAFGFVLGRAGLFLALLFFLLTAEKFCVYPRNSWENFPSRNLEWANVSKESENATKISPPDRASSERFLDRVFLRRECLRT